MSNPSAPQDPTSSPGFSPGTIIGHYRLVSMIGQGGFGDVWRAEELLPDGASLRDVALKLLSRELGGATWAEEAKLLASFRHPSLVTIYAAGVLPGGFPFVAMELLLGESLAETLKRRGNLPWRLALHYGRSVAAALDVIHERGIVHLDLKPANLFVTQSGAIKVLDFGISRQEGARAKLIARATKIDDGSMPTALFLGDSDPFAATALVSQGTNKGVRGVAGTPGFVAPEVLELADPTSAADAYALAATLVQLVTGRLPQAAENTPRDVTNPETVRHWWMELREATLKGKLVDLDREGIPAGMAMLLRRFLSVDPDARRTPVGTLGTQLDEAFRRPYGLGPEPYRRRPLYARDEGDLYARAADIDRLARDLAFEGLLVVHGPRGAGKTSFVLAGLVPSMAQQRVDERDDWVSMVVGPLVDVDATLHKAASLSGFRLPEEESGVLSVDDTSTACTGVAIVIDPFEEIATGKSAQATLRFLRLALRSPKIEGLRVIVIVDEDKLDELFLLDFPLEPFRRAMRYLAGPPAADAEHFALGPLTARGATIQNAAVMVDAVAKELRQGGVMTAVLLVALRAWWDEDSAHRGDSFVSREILKRSLFAMAETARAACVADDLDGFGEVLLYLVTTDGQLSPRTVEELGELVGDEAKVKRVITLLESHYLATRRGGKVSLVDRRLASWSYLESARFEAMDRLAFRERLRDATESWERSGGRHEYLFAGALLGELKKMLPLVARGLSLPEREFVDLSLRAGRRRRVVTVLLALVAIAAVTLVIFAKRRADEARLVADETRREAEHQAYLVSIVAKARKSSDPYEKVALLTEAIQQGTTEPSLGLELLDTSLRLTPARFLTKNPIQSLSMPWNGRFLVGRSGAGALVVIDIEPKNAPFEVLEHVDFDVDAKNPSPLLRVPKIAAYDLGAPIAEIVPFGFDTALAIRDIRGRVHVLRIDGDGAIAVVGVAPMTCFSEISVAPLAPLLACAGDDATYLWDVRWEKSKKVGFAATRTILSWHGERLAGYARKKLFVHDLASGETATRETEDVIVGAALSPTEGAVAIAFERRFEVLDPRTLKPLFEGATVGAPASIRFDRGGVDLAVCDANGALVWHYLRRGAREEPAPSGGCVPVPRGAPQRVLDRAGFGDLGRFSVGDHLSRGGFSLDGGFVTDTLVMFGREDRLLERAIYVAPRSKGGEPRGGEDRRTLTRAVRAGKNAALDYDGVITIIDIESGREMRSEKGHLTGSCEGDHVAAWRSAGDRFEVLDVQTGGVLGTAPRGGTTVVGINSRCDVLYTQDIDGSLRARSLRGGEDKLLARIDGIVFDAKASRASGRWSKGLLIAASSGAIARIDEATEEVTLLGYATPYATAISDGGGDYEVLFADATGVQRLRADGTVERIVGAGSGRMSPGKGWDDIAVSRSGTSALLASSSGLGVLDLEKNELAFTSRHEGFTRLVPWDEEGSWLALSPEIEGRGAGVLIPSGKALAEKVGSLASNLRVDRGRVVLKK